MSVWHGIYAPAGTPAEATDRLSAALQVALADATPAALEARLMSEIGRWQPIIEAAGVYAD